MIIAVGGLVAAAGLAFGVYVVVASLRALNRRQLAGDAGLLGSRGVVEDGFSPGETGRVRVAGELWKSVSDEPLDEGSVVRVVAVDGLLLHVERWRER